VTAGTLISFENNVGEELVVIKAETTDIDLFLTNALKR